MVKEDEFLDERPDGVKNENAQRSGFGKVDREFDGLGDGGLDRSAYDNLRYGGLMGQGIWTAEELSQLSPVEQDAIFEASLVTDLAEVPPEFLSQIRDRFEHRSHDADVPHHPR